MKFMSHLNNISHYRSPSKHKKTPHTFSNRLPSTKSPIRTCATKFSLCTRTESRFHSLCRQRLSLIRTGSWPSSVTLHYMMKEWASERLSLSFPLLTKSTGSSTAKKFTSAQVSIRTEREWERPLEGICAKPNLQIAGHSCLLTFEAVKGKVKAFYDNSESIRWRQIGKNLLLSPLTCMQIYLSKYHIK